MGHAAPLVLASDDLEVVMLPEHGARLHRLRAFGVDLLRTPPDSSAHATDPFFWGAYVMAPWCNRVRPGPMVVAGRIVEVAPNFPDGTAIHGQVSGRPWEHDGGGSFRVTGGGDGWPWRYEVALRVQLAGRTLTLAYALTNADDAPMPAGIGLHPWFRAPLELRVPADAAYAVNAGSPTDPQPVHGELDLRSCEPPAPGLDATWTGVTPPVVELAWPADGIRATLEVSTVGSLLVAVATPAETGAVAVEPQTHGPDGLRRFLGAEPDAPRLLEPGASLKLEVRLTIHR